MTLYRFVLVATLGFCGVAQARTNPLLDARIFSLGELLALRLQPAAASHSAVLDFDPPTGKLVAVLRPRHYLPRHASYLQDLNTFLQDLVPRAAKLLTGWGRKDLDIRAYFLVVVCDGETEQWRRDGEALTVDSTSAIRVATEKDQPRSSELCKTQVSLP